MVDERSSVTKRPAPKRKLHERFCVAESWLVVSDARGRASGHHVTFRLVLPSGDVLRTRISRPVDRSSYAPSMWSHILRDQLRVSAGEFWACVLDGELPDRGGPVVPDSALPLHVVARLVRELGLTQEEIAGLGLDEANRLLSDPGS